MSRRRVIRGGAVDDVTGILRSSVRFGFEPEVRYWLGGFRVVVRRQR